MFPSSPSPQLRSPRGAAPAQGVGWGSAVGRGVSRRGSVCYLGGSGGLPPRHGGAPLLQGPPSRKAELHYPAGLPPLSFLSCLCRGRRGGRSLNVTLPHSLSLCQSRDHFFFPSSAPSPRPPLFPSFPSLLPPSEPGFVRWGRGDASRRTRGTRGGGSGSPRPPPSLPSCPLPPTHPHPTPNSGSGSGLRNPEEEHLPTVRRLPPLAPSPVVISRCRSIPGPVRKRLCDVCVLTDNPGKPPQTISPLPPLPPPPTLRPGQPGVRPSCVPASVGDGTVNRALPRFALLSRFPASRGAVALRSPVRRGLCWRGVRRGCTVGAAPV